MVYSLFEKWTGIFQPALVCSTIRWMANLHETLTSTQWNAGESILMPLELHLLATRGEIEKLRLALDDDSSRTHIDAYDRLGMTPLMCAVQSHTHALFCRNPHFSSYSDEATPTRKRLRTGPRSPLYAITQENTLQHQDDETYCEGLRLQTGRDSKPPRSQSAVQKGVIAQCKEKQESDRSHTPIGEIASSIQNVAQRRIT